MEPMKATIILRKLNDTLRVGLPKKYVEDLGLKAGDLVTFVPEADGTARLKFMKVAEIKEMAKSA
jgi:hypothetical protein